MKAGADPRHRGRSRSRLHVGGQGGLNLPPRVRLTGTGPRRDHAPRFGEAERQAIRGPPRVERSGASPDREA